MKKVIFQNDISKICTDAFSRAGDDAVNHGLYYTIKIDDLKKIES